MAAALPPPLVFESPPVTRIPSSEKLPVAVIAEEPRADCAPSPVDGQSEIEIRLGKAQIRIRGAADPATLQLILTSLRR